MTVLLFAGKPVALDISPSEIAPSASEGQYDLFGGNKCESPFRPAFATASNWYSNGRACKSCVLLSLIHAAPLAWKWALGSAGSVRGTMPYTIGESHIEGSSDTPRLHYSA